MLCYVNVKAASGQFVKHRGKTQEGYNVRRFARSMLFCINCLMIIRPLDDRESKILLLTKRLRISCFSQLRSFGTVDILKLRLQKSFECYILHNQLKNE